MERLTGIKWANGSALASVDYTLDGVGNRTERVDGLGTHTYEYDDLHRLTGVTYPGPDDVDYTYDAVGNRLTLVTGAGTTQYAHDAADRISSVTPPGESPITYTWDDDGTLTARGSDSFTWDAAERLASATVGSATTFAYNGDNLRDSLTFNANTTTFTWDVNRSIPQVLDDESFQYLYGIGRIAQVGSGETHYYLTDGLGSTLALTGESGDIINAYEYDVFGDLRDAAATHVNDFTFAGEQDDSSTDLHYLRARYYDSGTGMFISKDPLFGSMEPFSYASASPTILVDPRGLAAESKASSPGWANVGNTSQYDFDLGRRNCPGGRHGAPGTSCEPCPAGTIEHRMRTFSSCLPPSAGGYPWDSILSGLGAGLAKWGEGEAVVAEGYRELGATALEECSAMFSACPQYVADMLIFMQCMTHPAAYSLAAAGAGTTDPRVVGIVAFAICAGGTVGFHYGANPVP